MVKPIVVNQLTKLNLVKSHCRGLNHHSCYVKKNLLNLYLSVQVGDSPLVGCGGYANMYGAVSATGHGEAAPFWFWI